MMEQVVGRIQEEKVVFHHGDECGTVRAVVNVQALSHFGRDEALRLQMSDEAVLVDVAGRLCAV